MMISQHLRFLLTTSLFLSYFSLPPSRSSSNHSKHTYYFYLFLSRFLALFRKRSDGGDVCVPAVGWSSGPFLLGPHLFHNWRDPSNLSTYHMPLFHGQNQSQRMEHSFVVSRVSVRAAGENFSFHYRGVCLAHTSGVLMFPHTGINYTRERCLCWREDPPNFRGFRKACMVSGSQKDDATTSLVLTFGPE